MNTAFVLSYFVIDLGGASDVSVELPILFWHASCNKKEKKGVIINVHEWWIVVWHQSIVFIL